MITPLGIDRVAKDVRSSFDSRHRVDAYFVEYKCPRDSVNPETEHVWVCRFEVQRGADFAQQPYESKKAARAAGNIFK